MVYDCCVLRGIYFLSWEVEYSLVCVRVKWFWHGCVCLCYFFCSRTDRRIRKGFMKCYVCMRTWNTDYGAKRVGYEERGCRTYRRRTGPTLVDRTWWRWLYRFGYISAQLIHFQYSFRLLNLKDYSLLNMFRLHFFPPPFNASACFSWFIVIFCTILCLIVY